MLIYGIIAHKLFGVLKGADSKSAVCTAQKCPISPQIWEIQDGHH